MWLQADHWGYVVVGGVALYQLTKLFYLFGTATMELKAVMLFASMLLSSVSVAILDSGDWLFDFELETGRE